MMKHIPDLNLRDKNLNANRKFSINDADLRKQKRKDIIKSLKFQL